MKKSKKSLKKQSIPFQSDITIDLNGDISFSFLGADLLELVNDKVYSPHKDLSWQMPKFSVQKFSQNSIKDEYKECQLCPKKCLFNRLSSQHPHCGDWHLRVSNFGISYGDEAMLSQGGGSGIIFLSGCSLTCPSCINPEKVQEGGNIQTIEDFILLVEKLYLKGVNNIQILSPTVHLPHLRVALKELKDNHFPLPIILKSSGFELEEEIRKLDGLVDIYVPDFKFKHNEFWQKRTGATDYHIHFERCLKEMYRQTGVAVKNNYGQLISGVLIRHVKNPYLSYSEQAQVVDYLNQQEEGIEISILDNFIILE